MHNPTNWQDYPSTVTPITAAQMKRIDTLCCAGYDLIDYTLSTALNGTKTSETLDASSTLILGHWCLYPNGYTAEDGLIVRINGDIVPLTAYTFDTVQSVITFDPSVMFEVGDIVTFTVYKRGIYPCTQAEYDAMSTHDANTLYVITG